MTFQVIALTGLILATISLIIVLILGAAVIGLKNSTHSVQYMPVSPDDLDDAEKMDKILKSPFQDLEDDENIRG